MTQLPKDCRLDQFSKVLSSYKIRGRVLTLHNGAHPLSGGPLTALQGPNSTASPP